LGNNHRAPSPIYESKILRKDGTYRWIEFRTVSIEYEGRRAILGNLLDITPRKELEIEITRSNKELAAINSIMDMALQLEGDPEKGLSEALACVTGVQSAQAGGIFLREKGGLVLKALEGSVEKLMDFIEDTGSSVLLGLPKAHKVEREEDGLECIWSSAPISFRGNAEGAIVVASHDADTARTLSFLEKAACKIGLLLEAGRSHREVGQPSVELMPKISTSLTGN